VRKRLDDISKGVFAIDEPIGAAGQEGPDFGALTATADDDPRHQSVEVRIGDAKMEYAGLPVAKIIIGREVGCRRVLRQIRRPVTPSSGSVGPQFRQCRFACSGSFGHRFKKVRLQHWLALARRVNFPSPGSGWTPFVLNGEGVIKRVERWGLFHPNAIEVLAGQ
jgi:hypothetical protein